MYVLCPLLHHAPRKKKQFPEVTAWSVALVSQTALAEFFEANR